MELRCNNITKQYRNKTALDGFSSSLNEGIYALLGPNGAGKSTLMNIIAGLLKPTSGEVLLDGKDILKLGADYRNILGYLPQEPGFYPTFTGLELMQYFAALKNVKSPEERITELLEFVNLNGDANRRYKEYSGGMKRRLGIAVSLLNDPKILILDEPTAGLDPKERIRFRNIIGKIGRDKIIILATHIVSDIESIADSVIMLNSGKIAANGSIAEVLQTVSGKVWEIPIETKDAEEYAFTHSNANLIKSENKTLLHIVTNEPPFENAVSREPTLEDVYMYLFDEVSEKDDFQ